MYVLHTSQIALISRHTSGTADSTYQLWHTRMGHLSLQRFWDPHNYALGVDQFLANTESFFCTICNFTKLIRTVNWKPFSRFSQKLGRVHTDIWRPYQKHSLDRHIYFISFIDDHTRKSWLICLQSKRPIQVCGIVNECCWIRLWQENDSIPIRQR